MRPLSCVLPKLLVLCRFDLSSFTARYWDDVLKYLSCGSTSAMRWSGAVLFFCSLAHGWLSEAQYEHLRAGGAAGLPPEERRGAPQLGWSALVLPAWTTISAHERQRGAITAGLQLEVIDLIAQAARATGRPLSIQHDEMSLNAGYEVVGSVREGETDFAGLRIGPKLDLQQRRQRVAETNAKLRDYCATLTATAARVASAPPGDGKEAASEEDAKARSAFRSASAAALDLLKTMRKACVDMQSDRVSRLRNKADRAASAARKKQEAENARAAEEKRAPVPVKTTMNRSPQESMWRYTYGECGVAIAGIDRALSVQSELAADSPISANLDRAAIVWRRAAAMAAAAAAVRDNGHGAAVVAGASEVADEDDDGGDDGMASDDEVDLTALPRRPTDGDDNEQLDPMMGTPRSMFAWWAPASPIMIRVCTQTL